MTEHFVAEPDRIPPQQTIITTNTDQINPQVVLLIFVLTFSNWYPYVKQVNTFDKSYSNLIAYNISLSPQPMNWSCKLALASSISKVLSLSLAWHSGALPDLLLIVYRFHQVYMNGPEYPFSLSETFPALHYWKVYSALGH